VRFSSNIEV